MGTEAGQPKRPLVYPALDDRTASKRTMSQSKYPCNRLFYRRSAHNGTEADFALGQLLATFRLELGQIPTSRPSPRSGVPSSVAI